MPVGLDEQTTFLLSEPGLDQAAQTQQDDVDAADGPSADNALDAADDSSDREPFGDFGEREPLEDIPESSDDGGAPMMDDGFSDRGDDVVDTTTATNLREPSRATEPRIVDKRLLKKRKLMSQHGIEYPSLPPAFVKRVAQTALQSSGLSNKRISTETLIALTQASEWYFEQLGDDLGAYANHAKRKTIEESDVATLMRR